MLSYIEAGSIVILHSNTILPTYTASNACVLYRIVPCTVGLGLCQVRDRTTYEYVYGRNIEDVERVMCCVVEEEAQQQQQQQQRQRRQQATTTQNNNM